MWIAGLNALYGCHYTGYSALMSQTSDPPEPSLAELGDTRLGDIYESAQYESTQYEPTQYEPTQPFTVVPAPRPVYATSPLAEPFEPAAHPQLVIRRGPDA